MRRFFDKAQSFTEYVIAALFIYGGLSLIGHPPIEAEGVLWILLGGTGALYVYMVWFLFLGSALLYAKLRQRKKLHKNILLCIYLTTIYTATLAVAFFGFHITHILDDLVVGLLSALFWIRWKFRTEYIDPVEFQKTIEKYRDDLPPGIAK